MAKIDFVPRFGERIRLLTSLEWQRVLTAAAKVAEAVRERGDYAALIGMPQIWWQSHFPSGKPSESVAEPSGLYFLDVPCGNPREFAAVLQEEKLCSCGVKLAYITHDGKALRLVAAMLDNAAIIPSFESRREWLASQLGISDYDRRPMTLASMCYAPGSGDVVYEASDLWSFTPQVLPVFTDAEDAQPKQLDNMIPEMPLLVQYFIDKSDPRFRAATVLAMLPILGGLATDLRMEYIDGEEHSPSFMAVMIAPQASGKSFARRIWRVLTERLHNEDAAAWEEERIWRESLRNSLRDFKKTEGVQKDPDVVIRLVPSKITEPMFFKRLHNAKGKHLIGFYEEIDSLTKEAKGASYDDKRDLFREAFDNAEHGRDVANVESFSGMERIFYNFLALGTPASVRRFYNNAEDGLVSRTIFYQIPIDIFDDIPIHQKMIKSELETIRQWTDYLIDLRKELPSMVGTDGKVHIKTAIIDSIAKEWRKAATLRAVKSGSQAEGIFLKRACVIAWRACCVFWLLWQLDKGADTRRKLHDCFCWIADMVLRGQCELFGVEIDRLNFERKQQQPLTLFERLPKVFTTEDVAALQAQLQLKVIPRQTLYRWKQRKLIQKINKSQFEKL